MIPETVACNFVETEFLFVETEFLIALLSSFDYCRPIVLGLMPNFLRNAVPNAQRFV